MVKYMDKQKAEDELESAIDYYLNIDDYEFQKLLKEGDSLTEAKMSVEIKPEDIKRVENIKQANSGIDVYLVAQDVIERGVRKYHRERG
jgi:hypothetical protein